MIMFNCCVQGKIQSLSASQDDNMLSPPLTDNVFGNAQVLQERQVW